MKHSKIRLARFVPILADSKKIQASASSKINLIDIYQAGHTAIRFSPQTQDRLCYVILFMDSILRRNNLLHSVTGNLDC